MITGFHVAEHFPDPREVIKELGTMLKSDCRIVIEVPCAGDAFLTLYDCDAAQRFIYWIEKLFFFTAHTLKRLALQAGFPRVAMQNYQRSPLSKELQWLNLDKPEAHRSWAFLETLELASPYANAFGASRKTDALMIHLQFWRLRQCSLIAVSGRPQER